MNLNSLQVIISEEDRITSPDDGPAYSHDSVINFTQWLPSYAGSGAISMLNSSSSTITGPVPTVQFHNNPGTSFFNTNTFYNYDGNVSSTTEMTKYDDHNDLLELWNSNHQKCASLLWDTRIGEKIATISNAQYSDVFYTSFEGQSGLTPRLTYDYNKGNWDFDYTHIVLGSAVGTDNGMTGRYYFNLSGTYINTFHAPGSGKKYYISLWYKGGVPNVLTSVSSITMESQITVGDWTLVTGHFTGDGTMLYVTPPSSGTCNIDELRLIPADAIIKTYTYDPLIGVTSQCDERNNIIYYGYDGMGRLMVTKDINGNIISLNQTVIQGHD